MEILQDDKFDAQSRLLRERELFRFDHAELGRAVAQKLELPDVFVDAIAFHHAHESLRGFLQRELLADAIVVASLFPHQLNVWNAADAAELRKRIAAGSGGHGVDPGEFLKSVQAGFERLFGFFEADAAPEVKLTELLEQATREAADSTTRMVQNVQELMQQAASAGKEVDKLFRHTEQLEQVALRDSLTGALNREGFASQADELLTRARRYNTRFALIYLDADGFKLINDLLGHAAGDQALQAIVHAVQDSIRQSDFVGRLGGDEFAVLLSDLAQPDAVATAERICARLGDTTVTGKGSATRKLAVSAGMIWVNPAGLNIALQELLDATDKLMYEAKRAGGGTLCYASRSATAPSSTAAV